VTRRADEFAATEDAGGAEHPAQVLGIKATVVSGPDAGTSWDGSGERCSVGTHPSSDFVLTDATVSRFHCEIGLDPVGVRLRDLGSKNGTVLDGMRINDAYLRQGSEVELGRTRLRLEVVRAAGRVALSERESFGELVGSSFAMRAAFAVLERAAQSDATVLLGGETGTGKERAAQALHEAGPRADGPFVVVDCGSVPANLLEDELFGHERGAYTGAEDRRLGVFEEADGGTLFLDEIGELPLELQPKLLGALERREVRRLGDSEMRPVDVRVVAATNRDLRLEVNRQTFRADLYYRLAVIRVHLPPLRERPDDLPPIVERLLAHLGAGEEAAARLRRPEFFAELRRAAWPGNVRELRNYLERCLLFDEPPPLGELAVDQAERGGRVDAQVPYSEARRRALDRFERSYLEALLELHGGNKAKAAREAGIGRPYLYMLLRRHDLL
jgi:two-component system, NtrC family, response regulator GlrR